MTILILEPILQRVISGLLMLLVSRHVSIEYLGYYSFLITILIAGQNISDSSIKLFILSKENNNFPLKKIRKLSLRYIVLSEAVLGIALMYLDFRNNIPLYFYLFLLIPFSWLTTQRIHVQYMRSENVHSYYKIRITCMIFMNLIVVMSIYVFHGILSLIFIQFLIEPVIYVCSKVVQKSETLKFDEILNENPKTNESLSKFQLLSLANWGIVLFDRFALGVFIDSRLYGIWVMTSLISKSGFEALGIGLNNWIRKKLIDRVSNFNTILLKAVFFVLLFWSAALILTKIILFEAVLNFFPAIQGNEKLFCLLIISSEVIVLFTLLNAKNLYSSRLNLNFTWIIVVMITSPVFIYLSTKNLMYGAIFALLRDLTFTISSSRTPESHRLGFWIVIFVFVQSLITLG